MLRSSVRANNSTIARVPDPLYRDNDTLNYTHISCNAPVTVETKGSEENIENLFVQYPSGVVFSYPAHLSGAKGVNLCVWRKPPKSSFCCMYVLRIVYKSSARSKYKDIRGIFSVKTNPMSLRVV